MSSTEKRHYEWCLDCAKRHLDSGDNSVIEATQTDSRFKRSVFHTSAVKSFLECQKYLWLAADFEKEMAGRGRPFMPDDQLRQEMEATLQVKMEALKEKIDVK